MHLQAVALEATAMVGRTITATTVVVTITITAEKEKEEIIQDEEVVVVAGVAVEITTTTTTMEVAAGGDVAETTMTTKITAEEIRIITEQTINESSLRTSSFLKSLAPHVLKV